MKIQEIKRFAEMTHKSLILFLCFAVFGYSFGEEIKASDNESGSLLVGEVSLVIGKAFLASSNEGERESEPETLFERATRFGPSPGSCARQIR